MADLRPSALSGRRPQTRSRTARRRRRGRIPKLNAVSSVWACLAVLFVITGWVVTTVVESLTVIITCVVGAAVSITCAAIAQRHPRVQIAKSPNPHSPSNRPPSAPAAQPVSGPAKIAKKRPKCSVRCRKSVQSVSRCRCSCGGRSHGADNPTAKRKRQPAIPRTGP